VRNCCLIGNNKNFIQNAFFFEEGADSFSTEQKHTNKTKRKKPLFLSNDRESGFLR
jgi:hypothetical protein